MTISITKDEIRRVRELCKATNDGCGNWSQDGVRAFFEVIPDPDLILALCDAAERGAEVMEEMVTAALAACCELDCYSDEERGHMRRALEAALAHRPIPEEAGK